MVRCTELLIRGLKVRILPGLQKRMNSSTAELVFVRHRVESLNLSSSSNVNATKMAIRSRLQICCSKDLDGSKWSEAEFMNTKIK